MKKKCPKEYQKDYKAIIKDGLLGVSIVALGEMFFLLCLWLNSL